MYSYEDRIRAIELYLKLGKRQAATRRQLGYPSKSSLLLWCQEYQRRQDLAPSYRRSWEKYSAEQKKVAVDHFMEHGRCVSVTLRALGYPCRKVLGDWIDERHPGVRTQLVGRVRGAPHLEETKRAAVITLCTRQGGAQVIADELAVCRETLYNWKNQLLGKEAPALMRRKSQTESCLPDDRAELEKTIATLKHDIHQLQLEHDLLQKANELLKKGLGVNLTLLSNREKVKLVDALRSTYALSDLLAKVDIARSSYFYHRARCSAPDKYADARRLMASVFEGNHRCYGYRRLQVALRQEKLPLSEKVVRRLMKQERLCAATAKRRPLWHLSW